MGLTVIPPRGGETENEMKITNALNERQGRLWMAGWRVAIRVGTKIFHTNCDGEGLWEYNCLNGEDHQFLGTSQLRCRTSKWLTRYVRRTGIVSPDFGGNRERYLGEY